MYLNFDPDFFAGAGVLTVFSSVVSIFSSIISIAVYIVSAIAIMNLCKKLSISNGWLGFIPIANIFKLGQVADKCASFNGEKKKYAKLLLTFEIVLFALLIPIIIIAVVFIAALIAAETSASEPMMMFSLFLPLLMFFLALVMLAVAVTYAVFTYIAYYKIYKVFVPENAVLFTVISIFVNVSWIFLLIASLKEPAVKQPTYAENANNYPTYN